MFALQSEFYIFVITIYSYRKKEQSEDVWMKALNSVPEYHIHEST